MWQSKWLTIILLNLWPFGALADILVQEVDAAGLQAWLVEDYHVPAMEIRLTFTDAGYASDPPDKQGRAAMAGAMLLEGAGDRDVRAFYRAMEDKAIDIDVKVDLDGLSISVKTLAEHRETAFELVSDMLLRPQLNAQRMEDVKRRFEASRRRQEESPYYLGGRALKQAAYGTHPYAQEKLGDAASVQALTEADLRHYIQHYLTKEHALIAVVGAIEADELRRLMKHYLPALPDAMQRETDIQPVTLPDTPIEIHVEKQLPQTVLMFTKEGISRDDPNYYAAYVLNHIVGGGSTLVTRLGEQVRKKRGLTYGIGTSFSHDTYSDRWVGYLATKHETAQQAREVIIQTLADVARQGVSEEEVREAVQYITGSFPLNVDSNAEIASYLIGIQLHNLGKDYLTRRNAYFEAVTREDVNAFAKTLMKPEGLLWVSVGKSLSQEEPVHE